MKSNATIPSDPTHQKETQPASGGKRTLAHPLQKIIDSSKRTKQLSMLSAVANGDKPIKQFRTQTGEMIDASKRTKQLSALSAVINHDDRVNQYRAPTNENMGVRGSLLQNPLRASEQPVQRFAYVKDKQIIDAYEGMENYPDVMSSTMQIDAANPLQSNYMSDRYKRVYENIDEFTNHTTDKPVDVGLLGHLAKWYRLPFSKGFFVLGEAHNVANYRRLIKESNQDGNVLGEGNSVPIGHYTQSRPERASKTPQKELGHATEHAMESILAKTSYALASLRDDLRRELFPTTAPKSTLKVEFVDTAPWLNYVTTNKPIVKHDAAKRPYYMAGDVRKTMKPAVQASEQNYQRGKTAVSMMNNCIKDLEIYLTGKTNEKMDALKEKLEALVVNYNNYADLTPKMKRTLYYTDLKITTDLALKLAHEEIDESVIARDELEGGDLIAEQAKHNKTRGLLGSTCTARDVFMYEAIVDASARGFKMAGIGNDHLEHLLEPLAKVRIKTITYSDFFSKHVVNAF